MIPLVMLLIRFRRSLRKIEGNEECEGVLRGRAMG